MLKAITQIVVIENKHDLPMLIDKNLRPFIAIFLLRRIERYI